MNVKPTKRTKKPMINGTGALMLANNSYNEQPNKPPATGLVNKFRKSGFLI